MPIASHLATPSLRALVPDQTWPEGPSVPSAALRDRVVLVSGAGGSLGRQLVERLARHPVRAILAVDTSEHALVQGQEEWSRTASETTTEIVPVLADLRHPPDRRRCLAAGPTAAPDLVIHAAAYKHVPFLEDRPIAAAQNNLLATVDWARACQEAGVRRFAFVSTDKVVAPISVMGQTKRWAEQWLRASGGTVAPPVSIVRLCNLFGSRGSVVPAALRRLRAGEAVPVTHPDMQRWMMAPPDAQQVLLRSITEPPGTTVPQACVEISIPTLIRRLIRHVRPDADPTAWMEETAPRPGERLQEPRWGPEEQPTDPTTDGHQHLSCPSPPAWVQTALDPLRQACIDGDAEAARRLLQRVARTAPAVATANEGEGVHTP